MWYVIVSRRCFAHHTLPLSYVLTTPFAHSSREIFLVQTLHLPASALASRLLYFFGGQRRSSYGALAVPSIQCRGLMLASTLFPCVAWTQEILHNKSASLGVQRASYFVYLLAEKRKGTLYRGTAWLSNNRWLSAWSAFKTSGCPTTLQIRAFRAFHFIHDIFDA
jgi:hypothetical protein